MVLCVDKSVEGDDGSEHGGDGIELPERKPRNDLDRSSSILWAKSWLR